MNVHVEVVEARDLIQATRDRLEGDERRMLSVVLGKMDNVVAYVSETYSGRERRAHRPVTKAGYQRSFEARRARSQTAPGTVTFTVLERGRQ